MTVIRKEWQQCGRNDIKYFLAQMFVQLALLPSLGHKEAIGTLGYPIASKLEDYLVSIFQSVDRHTHT